jgi:hypothetical protein
LPIGFNQRRTYAGKAKVIIGSRKLTVIPLSQLIHSSLYVGPEDPGYADVDLGRVGFNRRSLVTARYAFLNTSGFSEQKIIFESEDKL